MFVSRVLAVAVPLFIVVSIAAVQALNLLSGKMIKSPWKSMSQPEITFVSSNRLLTQVYFRLSSFPLEWAHLGLMVMNTCQT